MTFLKNLADFQYKHAGWMLIFTLLLTLVLSTGFKSVAMESDMSKMNPQDLEIYKLADKITDTFGGQDSTFILVRIEEGNKEGVYDIRDPKVIKFLNELQIRLEKNNLVERVTSAGMIFTESTLPKTLDQSKLILSNIPAASSFFNKDYSSSLVIISSDLGGGEKKILSLDKELNEILASVSKPEGVNVYVTGTPQIRTMILDLLLKDAVYTISLAAIIIFIMLIIFQKSLTKAFLIFSPLVFGLAWTLGIMGLLDIKLSVATVGIGAMILGLGIEYGVFIVSRYHEEREHTSSIEALEITVKEVGTSVFGSGTTTVVGFLALGLASMPMLRDLGFALSLGISAAFVAAIFINPSIIILEERFEHWYTEKVHDKLTEKKETHTRRKKLDEKNNR
jgi:hydrophobe/amphiphile efflux-3 (HAE3) family protein